MDVSVRIWIIAKWEIEEESLQVTIPGTLPRNIVALVCLFSSLVTMELGGILEAHPKLCLPQRFPWKFCHSASTNSLVHHIALPRAASFKDSCPGELWFSVYTSQAFQVLVGDSGISLKPHISDGCRCHWLLFHFAQLWSWLLTCSYLPEFSKLKFSLSSKVRGISL